MEEGAVHELPVGRHLTIDERGVGLRLTWRLERGFVNLSCGATTAASRRSTCGPTRPPTW